jgi:hypothetical protein
VIVVLALLPGRVQGDIVVEPPRLELAASQLEAKTGDLVTVSIRSGSLLVEETTVCAGNNTTDCSTSRNETFLPSQGPVDVWAVRANGVRLELVPDGSVNLTAGAAAVTFRVTDQFGFDVLRVEAMDRFTGAVAVPLQVEVVFSEEQKFQMWRDALRQMRDFVNGLVTSGEADRSAWTAFTVGVLVFLDLVVLGLVAHKLARARRGWSWVDTVRVWIPFRVHTDPTKYVMDAKDTWAPDVAAEARKQRVLFDARLRRRAIVDGLEDLRELLKEEDEATTEVLRLGDVIREARERYGLPPESDRRGKLRGLNGGGA